MRAIRGDRRFADHARDEHPRSERHGRAKVTVSRGARWTAFSSGLRLCFGPPASTRRRGEKTRASAPSNVCRISLRPAPWSALSAWLALGRDSSRAASLPAAPLLWSSRVLPPASFAPTGSWEAPVWRTAWGSALPAPPARILPGPVRCRPGATRSARACGFPQASACDAAAGCLRPAVHALPPCSDWDSRCSCSCARAVHHSRQP